MSCRELAPWGRGTLAQAGLGVLGPPASPHSPFPPPLCCSGLGYVLGSAVTELTGNWRWALRVSPASFSSLCFPPWATGTFQSPVALAPWHSVWRHGGCSDVGSFRAAYGPWPLEFARLVHIPAVQFASCVISRKSPPSLGPHFTYQ